MADKTMQKNYLRKSPKLSSRRISYLTSRSQLITTYHIQTKLNRSLENKEQNPTEYYIRQNQTMNLEQIYQITKQMRYTPTASTSAVVGTNCNQWQCYVCVFLLLCMFCSVYSVFIVPAGTLRLPWLRLFRAFSSVVRQVSPITGPRCPEGSRKLRLPDHVTMAQDGGKVVSLTHRPPLPPGTTPGTHFC